LLRPAIGLADERADPTVRPLLLDAVTKSAVSDDAAIASGPAALRDAQGTVDTQRDVTDLHDVCVVFRDVVAKEFSSDPPNGIVSCVAGSARGTTWIPTPSSSAARRADSRAANQEY
jgi:hypothetical protein